MFLDGPRNKGKLNINHVNLWGCQLKDETSVEAGEAKRSTTKIILSKISSKLGANSLGKVSTEPAPSNGPSSRQAKPRLLERSHSIVRNSSRGLRSRGNSVATSSRKVSSIRSPLRRTSSLYTSATAAAHTKIREKSNFIRFQHADREQAGLVKLPEANKRLRCAISNRVAKFDAWLAGHLSLVFILINLFLLLAGPTGTTLSAAVPRAILQPIWMDDGLISLDSSQASDEPPREQDELASLNNRWLVQMNVLEPDELALSSLTNSQQQQPPTSGPGGAYLNDISEPNEGDSFEEQVRLERRRLDRNRALEPPPWLRMQPMRRDGASSSALSNQQESVESGQVQYDEASGDQRATRGRQSRESSEQAYQELIGQLLEQTLDNGPLLGDLYDELDLRYQVANGGGDLKPAAASNKLLAGSGLGLNSAGIGGGGGGLTSDLVSPSDATLVIVGDEVSTGDDGAPLMSASFVNPAASSESYQRLASDPRETTSEVDGVNPSSGGLKSAAYMPQPLLEPQLAGLRLVALGDQQEQPQQPVDDLQLNPNAQAQSSFHVVEDIDQADGGQDMRATMQQQQQQQQQQTVSLLDVGDFGASESSYPAKRSFALGRATRRGPPVSGLQSSPVIEAGNNREQLAIMMIERGLFSEGQLVEAANRLREHLEGAIGLPQAAILGLYPIGERELLIKLDTSNLNSPQRANLIKNYNFARGYIVKSWPYGSQQSPVPLLRAILRVLSRDGSFAKLDSNVQLAQVMLPSSAESQEDDEELWARMYQRQQGYSWPAGDFLGDKSMATILSYLAANRRPSDSLAASQAQVEPPRPAKWPHLDSGHLQLVVLLLALLVALVLVRLATRPSCNRRHQLKRRLRSLWSSGSGSREEAQVSGEVAGQAKALEAGEQPPPPAYMSPKEYSARQFGLLAQRLAQLVGAQTGSSAADLESASSLLGEQKEEEAASKSQELDEASSSDLNEQATSDTEEAAERASGRFRSSRSYIRSLIEALTKSKVAQVVANGAQLTSREQQVDSKELEAAAAQQQQQQVGADESANVVSQMDISAAHLILDYMEKHLEDKERLRREWLELNGQQQGCLKQEQPSRSSSSSGRGKMSQATLNKLAKVGLSEENRAKNRNNQVVALDRNRVRLGAKHGDTNSSKQDYINASYIYDDDLRRPTHIIAQGPMDEQAAGHFWQMVWEQGVSVVVALTRLNENSIRMCHCYWPTAKDDALSGPKGVVSSPTPLESPNGDSNGRRSSVTSVLNGNGAGGPAGGPPHQPIVAPNGDTQNNILCFQLASSSSSTDSSSETIKLEVHLVSEHVSSQDYLVRNMYLVNRTSGETRTITQFHYLAWPETGVPTNVRSFLEFRRKVHKSYRNLSSPILVHCSDGGGRSGTYTLIDIILERIRNGAKEIDPRATLEHLRDQRAGLCASQAQFEFVLMALAEEIQIILNALPR